MSRRRAGLAALALLGVAWALGAEWVSIRAQVPENHLLDFLGGVTLILAGVWVIGGRPGNRTGPLLYAVGIVFFTGNYMNLWLPGVTSALRLAEAFGPALLGHMVLAFPSGRLHTRVDILAVWALYLTQTVIAVAELLLWNPRAWGCGECPWAPAITDDLAAYELLMASRPYQVGGLVLMVIAAMWWRARHSSAAQRNVLQPIWAATAVISAMYLFESFGHEDELAIFLQQVRGVMQISLPLIVLYGLHRARTVRADVGELVLRLRSPMPSGELETVLGKALSDSTVRLLYPAREGGRWITAGGRQAELPATGDGRLVTMLARDGRPYAALVHRAALDEELVAGVATAVGLALENEALQADIRAQLEEVRASRARIVAAGDEERRRVERNLHDGARDPLMTLSDREREVLALMAEGRSNQAIAQRLTLTGKTVETHIRSIFQRLQLSAADDGHRCVLAVLTYLRSKG